LKPVLPMLILAVTMSIFSILPGAQGQTAGSVIGSETVVYTSSNATQLNETAAQRPLSLSMNGGYTIRPATSPLSTKVRAIHCRQAATTK
jgi:hypothetical protein